MSHYCSLWATTALWEFDKGGLQIQHPRKHWRTRHNFTVHKNTTHTKKILQGNRQKFAPLLEAILQQEGRPSLREHVNIMGPMKRLKTRARILYRNQIIGQTLKSVAQYRIWEWGCPSYQTRIRECSLSQRKINSFVFRHSHPKLVTQNYKE
jgi:hypothetical protein